MRKQNVSTESAKKQIANEKKASFASDAASSSAAPTVTVFRLADEISGKLLHVDPLFGLMFQQLEEFGAELDPCESQAVSYLYALIDSASRYVADATKLCEDVQLAAREVRAPEPLSFADAHGVTVTISPGHARNYASIKADQLRVLTNLLSDDAIGELGLDKKDLDTFQLMAFDHANTMNSLIDIVADDVANSVKGGALYGKNDENKIDASNAADSDPTGLRMDPARTERFTSALFRMARSIHSLEAAAVSMKGQFDVFNGVLDPCATIRAFSTTMNEDINLVCQMLANEEAAESDTSKGGA
jgi:hypothetical protein